MADLLIPSGNKIAEENDAVEKGILISIPTAPGLINTYELTDDFFIHVVHTTIVHSDDTTSDALLYTYYKNVLNETFNAQSISHILGQIITVGMPVYDAILFTPNKDMSELLKEHVNEIVRPYIDDLKVHLRDKPQRERFEVEGYAKFTWAHYLEPSRDVFDKRLKAKLNTGRNFAVKKKNLRLRDPEFIEQIWEKHMKKDRVQYDTEREEGKRKFDVLMDEIRTREENAYLTAIAQWKSHNLETEKYCKQLLTHMTKKRKELANYIATAVKVRRAECLL